MRTVEELKEYLGRKPKKTEVFLFNLMKDDENYKFDKDEVGQLKATRVK